MSDINAQFADIDSSATDEPRETPDCFILCDEEVRVQRGLGTIIFAVLDEVAEQEMGAAPTLACQGSYRRAIYDIALAIREVIRLKAGGAT